jgi:hypothetical protein
MGPSDYPGCGGTNQGEFIEAGIFVALAAAPIAVTFVVINRRDA